METARVSECHRALTSWYGIIPNNSRDIFSQMFMNSSFTYSGAYPSIENYANLYNEGSQWAQVFVKGIYANAVVRWLKCIGF